MNLKKLNLTVLLVTIIVLVPTIQIVYASPLSTFYLSGGIYPHGVTYTIWRESSTYYAKNAYGLLQYSGTNASQIINNAVGNNRFIFLKAGIYELDEPISIASVNNLRIKGEGMGLTILKKAGIVKNDATPTYYLTIEDLTIDINGVAGECAVNLVDYVYYARIKNVVMNNTSNRFLMHWATTIGLIVENCIFGESGLSEAKDCCAGSSDVNQSVTTIFRNNLFKKTALSTNGGGFLTTGSSGRLIIEGNTFLDEDNVTYASVSLENAFGYIEGAIVKNNYAVGKNAGFKIGNVANIILNEAIIEGNNIPYLLVDGGNQAIIKDNIVHDGLIGITVYNFTRAIIEGNLVYNTNINRSSAWQDKGGIFVAYVENASISNNNIFDLQVLQSTTYSLRASICGLVLVTHNIFSTELNWTFVDGGSNSLLDFFGNVGFCTENSGNASVATGGTVNHGLAGTPTSIIVTPTVTGLTDIYVSDVGSSTFKINFAGGGTNLFYWYAEYQP